MADYAIVVGIQEYESASVKTLETPVEDALRMAAWLVAKGQVPRDNLILLLSPVVTSLSASMDRLADLLTRIGLAQSDFEAYLRRLDATGDLRKAGANVLKKAFKDVATRSGGGDRLFFYYAGHGMASRITFSNEDAVVPSDYEEGVVKAIRVSSIVEYFLSLNFALQFFFFDCCRDFQFGQGGGLKDEDLDSAPPPLPLDASRPAPDQFHFFATAPGMKALDGRGLLSDALIDGLTGHGRAIFWDRARNSYEVRADRLFDHINDQYKARPEPPVVGGSGAHLQVQKPRLGGEATNRSALIATLPEADAEPVPLTIDFVPPTAASAIDVGLFADGGLPVPLPGPPPVPTKVVLKPRTYIMLVRNGVFSDSGDGLRTIELYNPRKFDLAPVSKPQFRVGGPGPSPADPGASPRAPVAPARLFVKAGDPLAPLELLDASGNPVPRGPGTASASIGEHDFQNLPPGFYTARLSTPEGQVSTKTIELVSGDYKTITIAAPPPRPSDLVKDVIAQADFRIDVDNMVHMSERVGPVSAPSISTILTLANSATHRVGEWQGMGERLRRLDLDGSRSATRGPVRAPEPNVERVEVLLAVEPPDPSTGSAGLDRAEDRDAYLEGVRFVILGVGREADRFEHAGHPAPTGTPGIARYSVALQPGPYWLGGWSPVQGAAYFSILVLDGHATEMVLHQSASGRIQVFQFFSRLEGGEASDLDRRRRVDQAQRLQDEGRLAEALATLSPLLVPLEDYELRWFPALPEVRGIPTEGKNLAVVARVQDVLHFRIFDGDGRMVVGTNQKRLTGKAVEIKDIKKRLESARAPQVPTRSEKARIISAISALAGHSLPEVDPIAGCLAGHLWIREGKGRIESVAALARWMVERYPALPDAHVLGGWSRLAAGERDAASEDFVRALDAGFPITAALLRLLARAVAELGVGHERVKPLIAIAERLIPGPIWTAWRPGEADWTARPD